MQSGYQTVNIISTIEHYMKYNSKTKMLEFMSDESVFAFHEQLTQIMRFVMNRIGEDGTSDVDAIRLTREFFEQYSALTDALSSLRAHLPRDDIKQY